MKVLNFPTRGRSGVDIRPGHLLRPGSRGEHILQKWYGTEERASKFYASQFSEQLTPRMIEFIGRMEMAFIATSDTAGECDCSFRAGPAGFMRVLDEQTIAYPELRGNGVMATLGNIAENPHVGIFMVDFTEDLIGLHVNGSAAIVTPSHMEEIDPDLPEQDTSAGRRPVQWVLVNVEEAYIHCSKHIPKLVPQSRVRHWGSDNPRHKGGDYFGAVAQKQAALESHPASAGAAAADGLGEAG
ncbi:MAG TPA: pyridoxamine 5'-phosphate oxidase family protein [Streptosporangiaceae bacterium]|nr:pyridoxamine 5'-phosphate oxidase family protein [Streptosporangiaceae bacterium]